LLGKHRLQGRVRGKKGSSLLGIRNARLKTELINRIGNLLDTGWFCCSNNVRRHGFTKSERDSLARKLLISVFPWIRTGNKKGRSERGKTSREKRSAKK